MVSPAKYVLESGTMNSTPSGENTVVLNVFLGKFVVFFPIVETLISGILPLESGANRSNTDDERSITSPCLEQFGRSLTVTTAPVDPHCT